MTLRNPELVAPSRLPGTRRVGRGGRIAAVMGMPTAAIGDPTDFAGGALPSDELEWYREDPFANEHHSHWHVVYPVVGLPDPANPNQRAFKDRQGEIFFYMHQQMLARYDAERVALNLERVAPHADYLATIAIGYNPGPVLEQQGFSERPPNMKMVDIPPAGGQPGYTVAQHATVRTNVTTAVTHRAYTFLHPPVPLTDVSLFGSTVEANGAGIGTTSGAARQHYGSLHNMGHNLISGASVLGTGVMVTPTTAIRDPVFWEWHKHVDDFYATWQNGAPEQTFDDRPPVKIRKSFDGAATSPDIMFAFEDALPPGALQDLASWGHSTFGGAKWDNDFSGVAPTTDALETAMVRRRMALADRVTNVPIDHLTHRPFVYVFRVENLGAAAKVTTRVFIAPIIDGASGIDDRRIWIEMDKFVLPLAAGEKKVAVRRGAQSSVIRKPAEMMPELLKELGIRFSAAQLAAMKNAGLSPAIAAKLQPHVDRDLGISVVNGLLGDADFDAAAPFLGQLATILPSEQPSRPGGNGNDTAAEIEQQESSNYCTCGWPYSLLVPRGMPEGMPFRIVVISSDWQIDRVTGDEACGSLSFCGARDKYPDRRPMGYPFNARFADSVPDVVMANANMAFRDFTIRRMADVDSDD
jgi:hypothetical protein